MCAALVVLALSPTPGTAATQAATGGLRLAAFRADPSQPEFGRPFELQVRLRLAPGTTLFLPDTLLPADASASAGRGSWVESAGLADSLDVTATYPVVGYLNGEIELPALEAWVAPSTTGETTVVATRGADPIAMSATAGLERVAIPIGRIQITPLRELSQAGDSTVPRPPADVLGRQWSAWLALALGLTAAGGLGAVGAVAARIRERNRARPTTPRLSSRREALAELDRIRSLGWHREGKLPEFYAATTNVLRRFSEQREPDWGTALTSTELLDEIRARWGTAPVEGIASVIPMAERAKFGRHRPGPDDAEAHWSAVRAWIERMPDD
jgi:hypothetical protein